VPPNIERRHPRAIDPEYYSQIRFDHSRITNRGLVLSCSVFDTDAVVSEVEAITQIISESGNLGVRKILEPGH